MINNIQKIFISLVFFSITNTVFCAQNQMTLNDLVPFIEKTRQLYEGIQSSLARQSEVLNNHAEIMQLLQSDNQTLTESIGQLKQTIECQNIKYVHLIGSLTERVNSQEFKIDDLTKQNLHLLKMFHEQKECLDKLQQDLSLMASSQNNIVGEPRGARTVINSPTGNNNNHHIVIQNTSAMSSVNIGVKK